MQRIAYDLSMLLGFGLVVAGVCIMFGLGPTLIAAGVAVICMTLLAARIA